MSEHRRRYWAIRTDRDNRDLILKELENGRLRQGWGWAPEHDLRGIQDVISQGGNWWDRLSDTQWESHPHLKMLSSAENGIQVGDYIITPNLPSPGHFHIVEVTGEYYFEPIKLSETEDLHKLGEDYGHILPVRILTKHNGINKHSDYVHADIRRTLRARQRMWNLDSYGDHIESILQHQKKGDDLSNPTSPKAKLESAWEVALDEATKTLEEKLIDALNSKFRAAEWETPIKDVLTNLYPRAEIINVGGPTEEGADIIIKIPNHFGEMPWIIAIQVKNYEGEIGPEVLTQLRSAHARYTQDGKVIALIALTTAESESEELRQQAKELSNELSVTVNIALKNRLAGLLAEGLKITSTLS